MAIVAGQSERQALQAKMQALKARMQRDYHEAKERVSQVADWKFYVSQYPLLSLGGIALASYAMVPALANRSNAAPDSRRSFVSSASPSTIAGTLFAFATRTATSVLMGAASRWATDFVNRQMAELTQGPTTPLGNLSRDDKGGVS